MGYISMGGASFFLRHPDSRIRHHHLHKQFCRIGGHYACASTSTVHSSFESIEPRGRGRIPKQRPFTLLPSTTPRSYSFNLPSAFTTYTMSVPPEYVHARMQAAEARAHNAALSKSGKKYYTPSKNSNDPTPPMMGTPMAVPAEYVAAKARAEESRAHAKAAGAPEKRHYTPLRGSHAPAEHMMGGSTSVPAEYISTKEEEKSRQSSVTSPSDRRYSEETAYSCEKDYEPVGGGKRSLGRKLKEYLHH